MRERDRDGEFSELLIRMWWTKNLDVQIAGCSFNRINTIFTSLPVRKFVRSQAYIVAF